MERVDTPNISDIEFYSDCDCDCDNDSYTYISDVESLPDSIIEFNFNNHTDDISISISDIDFDIDFDSDSDSDSDSIDIDIDIDSDSDSDSIDSIKKYKLYNNKYVLTPEYISIYCKIIMYLDKGYLIDLHDKIHPIFKSVYTIDGEHYGIYNTTYNLISCLYEEE
jgi:hypothetical protein